MKKLIAFLMALVMVLSLAACGGSEAPAETKAPAANNATESKGEEAASAEPLKIVYCGTSLSSESGDRFVQLAEVIENKINAEGGVNGAELEFVLIDGGTDQQAYIDALLKALEEDGVSAIIGTFFSQYALACSDYVTDAEIPVFNIATNFEMAQACDYYYTNRCVDTAFSNVMAQVAIDNGCKNPVNVVYNTSNGYNDSKFMKEYLENAGYSSAGEIAFDNTTTTDYTPIVLQAMNTEGADGILLHATANTDGQSIVQLLHQYEYQYPIISNSNLFSASFIDNTGAENCVGLIGFAEYADTVDRPEIEAFREMCFGSDIFTYETVSWTDASFYDDVCLIVEAAKLAGANDKDSINDGLKLIEGYKGVMCDYSYHDDHSFADQIYLAEIVEGGEVVISEALQVTH